VQRREHSDNSEVEMIQSVESCELADLAGQAATESSIECERSVQSSSGQY
jgi:hypothetical protein